MGKKKGGGQSPHKVDKMYQLWQEGYQLKLIMIGKIKYIHNNPVKRGYVDDAAHWRYSSARDYERVDVVIDIERFW